MRYIEYLYEKEKAYKYGIVKIIPPASYRPALAFDMFSKQKLPTRYQVLQELTQGKVSYPRPYLGKYKGPFNRALTFVSSPLLFLIY
jgi:hypothetical protein